MRLINEDWYKAGLRLSLPAVRIRQPASMHAASLLALTLAAVMAANSVIVDNFCDKGKCHKVTGPRKHPRQLRLNKDAKQAAAHVAKEEPIDLKKAPSKDAIEVKDLTKKTEVKKDVAGNTVTTTTSKSVATEVDKNGNVTKTEEVKSKEVKDSGAAKMVASAGAITVAAGLALTLL